jgi:hypothetical protein
MSAPAAVSIEGSWRALVTASLLGTDRRSPPSELLSDVADLVADAVRVDDASRMLAAVAATAAARRAAFVALPPVADLQPPAPDPRPVTPPAASATWREIVAEAPVLEDEWMLTVIETGHRLAPDVLVQALARHRTDPVRRARVALAGGPVSAWLIGHVPQLAGAGNSSAAAEAVANLPDLAVPPDLAELLGADAHTFVQRLLPGFAPGGFGLAHRAVLVNLLARCRPAVLADAAQALAATSTGLGVALAELARLRHRMLTELGRPDGPAGHHPRS